MKKGKKIIVLGSQISIILHKGDVFQSHLDGSKHTLSLEIAMKLQYDLGADLIVAFDDHEYKNDFEHLKAYLRQLYLSKEILYHNLATI